MKKISSFTLIVSFICLSVIGLALLPLLPVRLSPSRSLPGFTVRYTMPGASSRVVETEVTAPLEAMLSRILGVKYMKSVSGNGTGRITVELDRHAGLDAARFEASAIVRQTWPSLPGGVSYPTVGMAVPDENSTRPFLTYTLNAPADPSRILHYAEEHIKPRLSRIPDIYSVTLSGAMPMEWRLEYDNGQLERLGLSVEDLEQALSSHLQREFLGTCDVSSAGGERRWIRLLLASDSGAEGFDPARVTVAARDGKLIRMDELVKVSYQEEQPRSYYRINGLNSIYLSIMAGKSANQLLLGRQISREMGQVMAGLPAGYEIHCSYDATEYIREELERIGVRTGATLLILLLFVWLVTRCFRYLLLIVCSLTVNMAVAVIFYYLCGLEMQFYSLAGITVSLNLMIDSTVVMADHIRNRHNLKAFLSVLAATLTTLGALVIVFFLDEEIRVSLQDFVAVVMINLAVSLAVSLFFVPSLMERMGLAEAVPERAGKHFARLRRAARIGYVYGLVVGVLCRWRWAVWLLLAAAFGSTLWLFVEKVYEGSYLGREEETVLHANVSLPDGSTLEQADAVVRRMEHFLSGFSEIRQFHTTIPNARRASIDIYFRKEAAASSFPYQLKSRMVSKALELGGASWSIYGLRDQGFSNDVRENAGSYRILMAGYNYDELCGWADSLKERLTAHRRIREVSVNAEFSWWKDDYQEFYLEMDRELLARKGLDASVLFPLVRPMFAGDSESGTAGQTPEGEKIRLVSAQSRMADVWSVLSSPFGTADGDWHKLDEFAVLERGRVPREIVREDRQYRLCLQYEYLGSGEMGRKVQRDVVEEFSRKLPLGYTAEVGDDGLRWRERDGRQYILLVIVAAVIFFITGVLFNSLRQPLVVIFMIPVSYIGVFLTFWLFGLNFDQGGFASLVLLCGITVNAAIYILNEYNVIRRARPGMPVVAAYVRAWQVKVVPVLLTVVSTVLGFIPFLWGGAREAFWFPLAAGTAGGLLLSVVGVFLVMPAGILGRRNVVKRRAR